MRKFLEGDGYFDERSMNEMATVCKNSKIRIDVHSEDHAPPHAHLFTGDNERVCHFYIDGNVPSNASDIRIHKGDSVPENKKHLLSEVVTWARGSVRGVGNWININNVWDALHPK